MENDQAVRACTVFILVRHLGAEMCDLCGCSSEVYTSIYRHIASFDALAAAVGVWKGEAYVFPREFSTCSQAHRERQ